MGMTGKKEAVPTRNSTSIECTIQILARVPATPKVVVDRLHLVYLIQ
jgi:hypothetical protein